MTTVVKDYGRGVGEQLAAFYSGEFPGGTILETGVAEEAVGLDMDSAQFTYFQPDGLQRDLRSSERRRDKTCFRSGGKDSCGIDGKTSAEKCQFNRVMFAYRERRQPFPDFHTRKEESLNSKRETEGELCFYRLQEKKWKSGAGNRRILLS